jgi:hypothetical protein
VDGTYAALILLFNMKKGELTLDPVALQVEEEEYTSRIIHYFNTGLLTLPEGATLRSYLADKLNCDPMRITKKYAGASCLGRRVYHFHNRPQPTVSQIQLAKAELDLLEQRFRQRVEEGRSGLPPPNTSLLMNLNIPAQANSIGSAAALQTLLMNLSSQSVPNTALSAPSALFGVAQALQSIQPNFLSTSQPLLEALGLQQYVAYEVILILRFVRIFNLIDALLFSMFLFSQITY